MKNRKWVHTGIAGVSALALLTFLSPAAMAQGGMDGMNGTSATTTATTGTTWNVSVGPMTQSGIMEMAFFPNVITVDAGDSVHFNGMIHTVTFPGPDGKIPLSSTPQALAPAGGGTYDGSTFTSSGLMTSPNGYTLQFTKAGVFPYYCAIHPGMMGVVIVNPAGTKYPLTQADYDAEAQQQEQSDVTAANTAVSSFTAKSVQNSNGTTTYYAQTDMPESQSYSFDLAATAQSGVTGSAQIAFAKPPAPQSEDVTYGVSATLKGLTPGASYTVMLSEGASGSGTMVPNSQFDKVTVNADGTASVSGSVVAGGIPQGVWNLDVCDSNMKVVATGLVDHPSFAYERFSPDTLNIHTGDSVIWTQTGPNEIHTVSFLPSDWKDVPSESLMPFPYGDQLYAGSGFVNSGFLIPGATYKLTFIKAGNYQYRCLLHDTMGMVGTVNVTGQQDVATVVWDGTVGNIPIRTDSGTTYVPVWYLMQQLQKTGWVTSWNGQTLNLNNSGVSGLNGVDLGEGKMQIDVNGQVARNVAGSVWNDPSTGNPTSYMPLQDIIQVLQEIGMNPTWDGSTLDVTPDQHQGSEPATAN